MKRRLALAAAVVAVGVLGFLGRARAPDGWDAIGFLRAVDDFNLAAFQPHFPGYPVYVALCKLLRSPALVSAIASAGCALALWRLAAWRGGAVAGWIALTLWAGALQPWLCAGAALADATATALVAAAFAALSFAGARAALLGGVAIALAIGARASYWPLALSFAVVVARWRPAPSGDRRVALAGAVAATLGWLAPFVAVVGVPTLVTLGRTQLAGHFADWGGSLATRPDLAARALAFARDLVYDGIWPQRFVLPAALAGCALVWRRPSPRTRAVAAIVVVPYALWALLAQNVLEQPRHLLPLVAALIVAVAVAAERRPLVGFALALLAFVASAPLVAHRGIPAAAVVAHRVAASDPGAAVFARRSARVMQAAEPALLVRNADRVSDIVGTLERLDRLPRHVFYVAEELVSDDPARSAIADDSLHFCRDARVDRQSPCVTLRSYNWHP